MIGFQPHELIGQSLFNCVHPIDGDILQKMFHLSLEMKQYNFNVLFRIRDKSKQFFIKFITHSKW